jgi:hypothetical protein
LAYALLFDAIAHMASVELGQDCDYLEDAWRKLKRARALCAQLDAGELRDAIRDRLGALVRLVDRFPKLAALKQTVDAAWGEAGRVTLGVAPIADNLPWFDDRWIFSG